MKFQPLQKLALYMIAGLLALITHPALAQYPNKPIRFVVWAPAGGTADAAARVIATSMSQTLGQPVVVDNKPGADGIIAADLVAEAPPDGYTITMANAGSLVLLCHKMWHDMFVFPFEGMRWTSSESSMTTWLT